MYFLETMKKTTIYLPPYIPHSWTFQTLQKWPFLAKIFNILFREFNVDWSKFVNCFINKIYIVQSHKINVTVLQTRIDFDSVVLDFIFQFILVNLKPALHPVLKIQILWLMLSFHYMYLDFFQSLCKCKLSHNQKYPYLTSPLLHLL